MGFRINGEIALDGHLFKHGLNEASEHAAEFFKEFALGAIGIYGVEQAFHKTIETAEQLADASKNLSITTDQLQILKQAAKENGLEFGVMTTALQRFNAVRENIINGGKGSAAQLAALGRLGVSPEAMKSQTGAGLLMEEISKTARRSNAADIANDLKQVFGRAGTQLFGTLQTDFDEFGNEMKKAGMIMDTETIARLKIVGDEFQILATTITAQLGPALVQFVDWLLRGINKLQQISGFYGRLQYEVKERFGTDANIAELIVAYRTFMETSKDQEKISMISKQPVDPNAGYGAGALGLDYQAFLKFSDAVGAAAGDSIKASKSTADFLVSMEEKFQRLQYQLEHPTPQNVDVDVPEHVTKKKRERQDKSDSLIEVGNFLGSARGSFEVIGELQLETQRQSLAAHQKLVELQVQQLTMLGAIASRLNSASRIGLPVDFGG